ncbi:unnamed protein product [Triticum turgidum subsp. durum]|uniref:Uncharacterized protein n=1 Tax=Triticum turgidum subsp. durum TaxID=4567 RepID=A0A9R0QFS7_TRITD|nr:unnamed protein product [Triticum turgidum subsp. durum]
MLTGVLFRDIDWVLGMGVCRWAYFIPGSDVSGHAPFLCGFERRGMWWLFVRRINGWCCHQEQSGVTIIDIVFKWMAEIDLEVIVYVLSTWYHITLWNGMEEVAITTGEEDADVLLHIEVVLPSKCSIPWRLPSSASS